MFKVDGGIGPYIQHGLFPEQADALYLDSVQKNQQVISNSAKRVT